MSGRILSGDYEYDRAIELGGDDEPDDRVTCNRCGTAGLHWQEIVKADGSQGSKLFTERNRPHVCQEPSADAFGEVPE